MKTIAIDKSPATVREFNAATKDGYILLTRGGKPIAYVLPTRFYDEEDIGYMTDPEFWKMIGERRTGAGVGVALEEIEAGLAKRGAVQAKSTPGRNGKKGK